MHRARKLMSGVAVFLIAGQLAAHPWIHWPVSAGGNGHWYSVTDHGTWDEANAQAQVAGGYLAAIASEAENTWLTNTFRDFYTRAGEATPLWIPAASAHAWIGYRDSGGTWGWENGEPLTYENRSSLWDTYSGIHAYLHLGNHPEPGTWNHNAVHDSSYENNDRGIIERETPPAPCTMEETAKVFPSDGETGDAFGYACDIDGDVAVVGTHTRNTAGSNQGGAYAFRRSPGTSTWVEEQIIDPPEDHASQFFGDNVAINGGWLLAGAPRAEKSAGLETGAVYVYKYNENATPKWESFQKLTPSDGASGDHFGAAVSIKVGTILVGAYHKNAAYVFRYDGQNWVEMQKLLPAGEPTGEYGRSVSVQGDTLVVGAQFDGPGSAFVFVRDRNGTSTPDDDVWVFQTKLILSDPSGGDCFGQALSLSPIENTVAVGAYKHVHSAPESTGAVYVFERNDNGTPFDPLDDSWSETAELMADGPSTTLGVSVSIQPDMVAAGDYDSNVVFVFEKPDTGWQTATQSYKLMASDTGEGDGHFGVSVSLDDGRLLIGASQYTDSSGVRSGAAYVLDCKVHLTCDAGGPYSVPCQGPTTAVTLDGTASFGPAGATITYEWTTDCPGSVFDDPTSPTPTLTVDTSCACDISCNVMLTISNGTETSSCTTSVSIAACKPTLSIAQGVAVSCAGTVPVFMTNRLEVIGFQLGVSHDPAILTLEGIVPGPAWQALGLDPESNGFWNVDLEPQPCEDGTVGGTLAVIVSLDASQVLPAGEDAKEIVDLAYRARTVGSSPISFVGCLGNPPVAIEVAVGAGGTPTAVTPETSDGSATVVSICHFVRGDADGNGSFAINDPITILYYMFQGLDLRCLDAADVNDNGQINIVDAVYSLDYLFRGGLTPPPPFPEDIADFLAGCGPDETPDNLIFCDYRRCDSP